MGEKALFDAGAQDVAVEYISALRVALRGARRELIEEAVESVVEHLSETIRDGGHEDAVAASLEDLGSAEEYASRFRQAEIAVAGTHPRLPDEPERNTLAAGRLLGMPYDIRLPTVERVRVRWWNPSDPRIFMPRAFGAGWDLSFGALAVRLGLVRPDDEDEPFESVPESWMLAAFMVPVAATAAIIWVWFAVRGALPAQIPTHWGASGAPDGFGPARGVFVSTLITAGVPTLWAGIMYALGRSRAARVLVSAAATLFATIGAGVFLSSVLWGLGRDVPWLVPATILLGLILPFVMLVALARANRRAEWRKVLG